MAEITEGRSTVLSSARSVLSETGDSLRSVFRNPNLRRIQLALAGSMIGDWAYATAVAVWAYGVGGAQAVGIWTAIRLALMAITAPMAATIADRLPRKHVMIAADVIRAGLVALAALCLALGLPPATVFVLATLTALIGGAFRPAQRALMPALANRPEELTASNGTSSTLELAGLPRMRGLDAGCVARPVSPCGVRYRCSAPRRRCWRRSPAAHDGPGAGRRRVRPRGRGVGPLLRHRLGAGGSDPGHEGPAPRGTGGVLR